jgi:hypothetical protein
MRILFGLAAPLALAACAHQPPPQAAPTPALKSQVHFYDSRTPADGPGEWTVRFDDGSGERIVRPADFHLREWGFPTSERLDTRTSGTLHIAVTFTRGGRAVGEGAVDLPIRPDWIYGISLMVTSRNPVEGCMGCMGVRSFPIAGATGANPEKLHIVWGGNSISAPTPS